MTTTDTAEARKRAHELRSACHGSEARAFDELIATIRNRLEFSGASWWPEAVEQIIDGYDAFVVREFAARGAALSALTAERDAAVAWAEKAEEGLWHVAVDLDAAERNLSAEKREHSVNLAAEMAARQQAYRDLSAVRAREEGAVRLLRTIVASSQGCPLCRRTIDGCGRAGGCPGRGTRAFLAQHATPDDGQVRERCPDCHHGVHSYECGATCISHGEPRQCSCARRATAATPAPVREAPPTTAVEEVPADMLVIIRNPDIQFPGEHAAIQLLLTKACRVCLAREVPYWHLGDRPCLQSADTPPYVPSQPATPAEPRGPQTAEAVRRAAVAGNAAERNIRNAVVKWRDIGNRTEAGISWVDAESLLALLDGEREAVRRARADALREAVRLVLDWDGGRTWPSSRITVADAIERLTTEPETPATKEGKP